MNYLNLYDDKLTNLIINNMNYQQIHLTDITNIVNCQYEINVVLSVVDSIIKASSDIKMINNRYISELLDNCVKHYNQCETKLDHILNDFAYITNIIEGIITIIILIILFSLITLLIVIIYKLILLMSFLLLGIILSSLFILRIIFKQFNIINSRLTEVIRGDVMINERINNMKRRINQIESSDNVEF